MTVGEILARNARRFPKKLAVVGEGEYQLTYGELDERVNRLASFLLKSGLKKGDRIGVLVHNCPQFVELYYAAAKTGGIFCPYNNHLKAEELVDLINYSSPKFLFLDVDFGTEVNGIRSALTSVETYVCLHACDWPDTKDYETVIANGSPAEPKVAITADDAVSIIFTSGTTGRPKGAVRTHGQLMSNTYASEIDLRVRYDERVLISFPMYHVAGEDNIVRHTFLPNTLYIKQEGGFEANDILKYLSDNRITRCQFVPTMIHRLLQVPDIGRYDLSSLRLIIYSAAPMPVELLKKALAVFPCGFAQLYGQTEGGPFTAILQPEDHMPDGTPEEREKLASTGKAVINHEIRVVNEADEDVPTGQVGEIVLKSEALMKEYWQMPEETAEKMKNGWLHTGDVGRLDEDGFLYIMERKGDMIISGGVNIFPRQVEEVLYRHPAVSEASVIGIPDEQWGEIVKAVIVLKDGAQATEREIKDFCGKHLAGYKKPKSVDFWKELPKNSNGKILKKDIRVYYNQPAAEQKSASSGRQ